MRALQNICLGVSEICRAVPDLIELDVPAGEPIKRAQEFIQNFVAQGNAGSELESEIGQIVGNPTAFFSDALRAPLTRAIYRPRLPRAPARALEAVG